MKDEKYYAVSKNALPEVFTKVLEVKELLYSGKSKDVSEATKQVGISRSTYYKYKDSIYALEEGVGSKKITIIVLLSNKTGALSRVLDFIATNNVNVLTISQDIPINMAANVTITLDISNIKGDVKEMLYKVGALENVLKVRILAVE